VTLAPGQRVRVSSRSHDGHNRTPAYLRGRIGTVERGHPGRAADRVYADVFEHWLEEA